MIKVPVTLNSEVYVQLSNSTFNSLRESKLVDYKQYTSVKPYLRKNNDICRYTIDRPLPNCYLLVKDFSDDDVDINDEFALMYLEMMHGVTQTHGDDVHNCVLLNINRGARFYLNSENFSGSYAYWCLKQLDLIGEAEYNSSELTIFTNIGNLNIAKGSDNTPIRQNSFPNSPSAANNYSVDAKEIASMFDFKPPTPFVDSPTASPSHADFEVRTPRFTEMAEPIITRRPRSIILRSIDSPHPELNWTNHSPHTDDVRSRYDKEAMLKYAISILSLPVDPEFINENTAIRRAMYSLFWELNQ